LRKICIFAEISKDISMATITLKYDARNVMAKKIVDFIKSTGVFSISESDVNKETFKAIEDANRGKNITKVKNHKKFIEECLK
jgi:hypothetical protein